MVHAWNPKGSGGMKAIKSRPAWATREKNKQITDTTQKGGKDGEERGGGREGEERKRGKEGRGGREIERQSRETDSKRGGEKEP